MRPLVAPLALLLVMLLSAAPAALAQGLPAANLTVYIEDPGRALTPGAEEAVTVNVNYQPGSAGRPAPAPSPDRPEDTQPTRIVLSVKEQPSWVTSVRFDPPELFVRIPFQSVSNAYRASTTAYLMVAPDAPALQREAFVVVAEAQENGNIPALQAESSPDTKLRATTLGLLNVTGPEMVVVSGGRWTTIPFTVRNDGNSDILAKINVTLRPENSQVEFLETLQLKHNETQVVEVRLRTPWTNAEVGAIELEAVPIVDGEAAASSRAEVDVRGQSAVPAPPLAAIAAVALGLALGRRRA